jgi:hypothetical protein
LDLAAAARDYDHYAGGCCPIDLPNRHCPFGVLADPEAREGGHGFVLSTWLTVSVYAITLMAAKPRKRFRGRHDASPLLTGKALSNEGGHP